MPEVPALSEESSEKRADQNVIRGASREGRSDLESTLLFDYMPAPKLPREAQVPLSQIIEEKQAERRETQTENRAKWKPKTFESEKRRLILKDFHEKNDFYAVQRKACMLVTEEQAKWLSEPRATAVEQRKLINNWKAFLTLSMPLTYIYVQKLRFSYHGCIYIRPHECIFLLYPVV